MKSTMKKKLISTALAAIMSVSALGGTVLSANSAYKFEYNYIPSEQLFVPSYVNLNNYNLIFNRNEVKTTDYNNTCYHYDILAIPNESYAKVYRKNRGSFYVTSLNPNVKHYSYNVKINKKTKKRVGYPDWEKSGKAYLLFGTEFNFQIGCHKFPTDQPCKYVTYNGDVNNDKEVDIEDAQMVLNYVRGGKILTEEERFFADVNNDEKIDIADAVAIINHINAVCPIK